MHSLIFYYPIQEWNENEMFQTHLLTGFQIKFLRRSLITIVLTSLFNGKYCCERLSLYFSSFREKKVSLYSDDTFSCHAPWGAQVINFSPLPFKFNFNSSSIFSILITSQYPNQERRACATSTSPMNLKGLARFEEWSCKVLRIVRVP